MQNSVDKRSSTATTTAASPAHQFFPQQPHHQHTGSQVHTILRSTGPLPLAVETASTPVAEPTPARPPQAVFPEATPRQSSYSRLQISPRVYPRQFTVLAPAEYAAPPAPAASSDAEPAGPPSAATLALQRKLLRLHLSNVAPRLFAASFVATGALAFPPPAGSAAALSDAQIDALLEAGAGRPLHGPSASSAAQRTMDLIDALVKKRVELADFDDLRARL